MYIHTHLNRPDSGRVQNLGYLSCCPALPSICLAFILTVIPNEYSSQCWQSNLCTNSKLNAITAKHTCTVAHRSLEPGPKTGSLILSLSTAIFAFGVLCYSLMLVPILNPKSWFSLALLSCYLLLECWHLCICHVSREATSIYIRACGYDVSPEVSAMQ